jgi:molecular chaperone HtpG
MPKVDKSIYYLTGESLAAVCNPPPLSEVLKKKGFEALIINPVDKYAIVQLKEFHGKKLICCRYYQQQVNNSEQPLTMVL